MNKSYYILPVYNKETLILDVLNGIKSSHSNKIHPPIIICILDGCIDNTENIILEFKDTLEHPEHLHMLYMDDVHEIACLNRGLGYIKTYLNPEPNDLIFMVQDDVILMEPDIDILFNDLFSNHDNLGYISMRFGCSVNIFNGTMVESNFIESEFGHWDQLNWGFHTSIKHLTFNQSEIAVRSPTCTQWKRYDEVGFFDVNLMPCGYDCHEFSIRMNKLGYINGVFIVKYTSLVDWGTMRSGKESLHNDNLDYNGNKRYIIEKHKDYFLKG
jgi:hypothetical protein